MQSYPFSLTGDSITINAAGDLFVYQKGASAGSTELSVKSDIGGEIDVIPGQRFRLPGNPTRWTIKVKDGASTVTGKIIIGSGEFDDANTLNKVTLDATFANQVTVTNTPASRVPVTLDLAQTLPVSIAGQVQTSGGYVAYTHKHSSSSPSTANTAIQLLSAATNVNGAVLEKFDLVATGTVGGATVFSVLANATTPAGVTDGDILYSAGLQSAQFPNLHMDGAVSGRIKVPAGKGIWYVSSLADSASLRSALFTVL